MSGKKPSTPPPTKQEKTLAYVGAENYNDYVERFVPLTEDFVKNTTVTDSQRGNVAGIANADAAQAFATLEDETVKGGLAKGVGSGSGKTIAGIAGGKDAEARARGQAKGAAVQDLENTEINAKMKGASFGRGLGDDAKVGLMQATGRATALANANAQAAFKKKSALMEGIGTGIGAYTSLSGMGDKKKPKAASTSDSTWDYDGYDMDGG